SSWSVPSTFIFPRCAESSAQITPSKRFAGRVIVAALTPHPSRPPARDRPHDSLLASRGHVAGSLYVAGVSLHLPAPRRTPGSVGTPGRRFLLRGSCRDGRRLFRVRPALCSPDAPL